MPVDMDVTLTVTGTAQQLYALLAAINPLAPRNVSRLEIQGDDGQSQPVFIGGPTVSTTVYSHKLVNGGDIFEDSDGMGRNVVSTPIIYLVATSGSQSVHVRARTS